MNKRQLLLALLRFSTFWAHSGDFHNRLYFVHISWVVSNNGIGRRLYPRVPETARTRVGLNAFLDNCTCWMVYVRHESPSQNSRRDPLSIANHLSLALIPTPRPAQESDLPKPRETSQSCIGCAHLLRGESARASIHAWTLIRSLSVPLMRSMRLFGRVRLVSGPLSQVPSMCFGGFVIGNILIASR